MATVVCPLSGHLIEKEGMSMTSPCNNSVDSGRLVLLLSQAQVPEWDHNPRALVTLPITMNKYTRHVEGDSRPGGNKRTPLWNVGILGIFGELFTWCVEKARGSRAPVTGSCWYLSNQL